MFERRLDQLTDVVEASLNFRKNNDYGSANRDQQFSHPQQFREATCSLTRFLTFSLAEKCRRIHRRIVVFPLEPSTELMRRTFVSFMPALVLKLESVECHVLGNRVILVTSTITLITAWHLIPAVRERSFCQRASLFFTILVQTCVFSFTRALKSV